MDGHIAPFRYIQKWAGIDPMLYQFLDIQKYAAASEARNLPKQCVLSTAPAVTYLTAHGVDQKTAESAACEITASWAWWQKKLILTFDNDFTELLTRQAWNMEMEEAVPADRFFCLPAPCVYVRANILPGTDGFFAWFDYNARKKIFDLRFQWLVESGSGSYHQFLHFREGWTWRECVRDTVIDIQKGQHLDITYQETEAEDLRAVQLVLYILADNVDVQTAPPPIQIMKKENNVVNVGRDPDGPPVNELLIGNKIGRKLRKLWYLSRKNFTEYGKWKQEQTFTRRGKPRTRLMWIAPDSMGKALEEPGENAVIIDFPD